MNEVVALLLEAPDSQLDASMKPLIKKWSSPPKAIEVLEVVDAVICGSLANGFTTKLLQMLYEKACKDENTTHEEIVKNAGWREVA